MKGAEFDLVVQTERQHLRMQIIVQNVSMVYGDSNSWQQVETRRECLRQASPTEKQADKKETLSAPSKITLWCHFFLS